MKKWKQKRPSLKRMSKRKGEYDDFEKKRKGKFEEVFY